MDRSYTARTARLLAVCAVSAALLAPTVPAGASEDPDARDGDAAFVDGGRFDRPGGDATSVGMWVWERGRRAYYLTDLQDSGEGFENIVAYDLDRGVQVASQELSPNAAGGAKSLYGAGLPVGPRQVVAVDEAGGRLFVASNSTHGTVGPTAHVGVSTTPEGVVGRGEVCFTPLSPASASSPGCVAGVQVLDAGSLERVGPLMPLRVVSASGGPVAAQLLAMSFSPSRGEGDGDKVLLLVADHAGTIGAGFGNDLSPRVILNHTPTFVVQLDVDSGRQDWVVAVDACRGSRNNRNNTLDGGTIRRPNPGAVYRRASVTEPMVVVACHSGSTQVGTVVRIPLDERGDPAGLPVRVADPGTVAADVAEHGPGASPQTWVAQAAGPLVTVGPEQVWEMIADPASDRVLLRVVSGPAGEFAEVWWVFDVGLGAFAGTIGIGAARVDSTNAVLDTVRGRLYVLADALPWRGFAGGLFVADVRRTPVAQALVFPELEPLAHTWGTLAVVNLVVASSVVEGESARLFVPDSNLADSADYRVLVDRLAVTVNPPPEQGFAGRTLDLEEAEGVTGVSLDGAARGYAARALLVGGVEAAARMGPADPLGLALQCNNVGGWIVPAGQSGIGTWPCGNDEGALEGAPGGVVPRLPDGCVTSNPEVVLGFVGPDGPAVVDGSGARGGAEPVRVDSGTAADLEAPVSRCSGVDWDVLTSVPVFGGVALLGGAGVGEPRVSSPWSGQASECVSGKDDTDGGSSGRVGDPVSGAFVAATSCERQEASGFAYVRGNQVGDVAVGEALSSFRIYRDPGRGIVSRVESVARGIEIAGVARIDTIRGQAESWANGRAFTPPDDGEDAGGDGVGAAYEPNCDFERTAGTCFRRHVVGVWTPGYSCGPCGDEGRLIAGLNRALGVNGKAFFRDPDPVLARGADNGFTAAITKRNEERFSDLVLNNDLLQTVLPTLEIVRYAPSNRVPSGGGTRGRQIYQFAGVEVSSSYGISCLLVYDEEAGTCAGVAEPPGSITVSLSDPEGEPLAGGAFELRQDVDADGVLGLKDTLLPDGACVTADDGVGTCVFEGLTPGAYLVSQVAAPPGYAKSAEPWVSEVASGEQRTVAFTNVSNVSTIDMTVTDEDGQPLSGAAFAAYPDPDADGKVAPDAQPAATCTTDAQGVCSMQVPAGSYVLVQTGAPGGLEGIEPVAFTFSSGGQVAAVTVVNYPPSQPAAPEGAASPTVVDYTAPVGYSPPVESIDDAYVPADSVGAPATAGPSVPEQIGGTVVRVIRAPGDALRLLARDPQQAVAFTAALALLVLALLAVRRRQLLGGLTAMPAFAFTGGGTPPTTPPAAPPRPRGPSGGGGPSSSSSGSGPSGGDPGGGSAPPSGNSGDNAPSTSPASSLSGGAAPMSSTAVLDRPIMGGAPAAVEHVSARVVAATALPGLSAVVTHRLADSPSCEVLAVVGSLEALRAAVAEQRPDVLVVDLGLVSGGAADVCDLLPRFHPLARTVGLIPPNRSAEALAVRGYGCGLGGLLVADEDLTNGQLAYAVRCVAAGKIFFGPTVQALLLAQPRSALSEGQHASRLSRRELEVARLAVAGVPRAEIAKRLYVTPSTVKTQLRAIRAKLGVTDPRDPVQLRQRLDEFGLLDQTGDHPDES